MIQFESLVLFDLKAQWRLVQNRDDHEGMIVCDFTNRMRVSYHLFMSKFVTAFLLLSLLPLSAFAGETDWEMIAPDTRVRLISSDVVTSDNTTMIGIELDMPTDMKTYWRIPGETGIPTQVDMGKSTGIGSHKIIWPYPTREHKGGYLDFVYHGPTLLPLELKLTGKQVHLEADIVMGVCSDICVPVQAKFTLPLDFTSPDRGQGLRLRQALSLSPIAWMEGKEPLGKVSLNKGTGSLDVEYDREIVDPRSIIVDNGDPTILFEMPQKGPIPGVVSFLLLDRDQTEGLQDKPISLTFMTSDGAFELTRIVQ